MHGQPEYQSVTNKGRTDFREKKEIGLVGLVENGEITNKIAGIPCLFCAPRKRDSFVSFFDWEIIMHTPRNIMAHHL